ncbi:class I SAM-dependent methyltransferase [Ruegeria hyattellae]|uniref:class I SAM-dependent methyltransferase n=1 Tax=Ruegeria hyattellae TaxID=3233337 RepID=UPI00355B1808
MVDKIKEPIDLCFIDAMHNHPWPLADTLAVLPLMKPDGIIVHHDLQMFHGSDLYATGPKVLRDQVPKDLLLSFGDFVDRNAHGSLVTRQISDNIYAIRVSEDLGGLAETLSLGFCIGWDVDEPGKWLPHRFSSRLCSVNEQKNIAPEPFGTSNSG